MTMIETIAADAKAPAPETQDVDPSDDGDVVTKTHVYTEVSEDLQARPAGHNTGEVLHTSEYKPWRIPTDSLKNLSGLSFHDVPILFGH